MPCPTLQSCLTPVPVGLLERAAESYPLCVSFLHRRNGNAGTYLTWGYLPHKITMMTSIERCASWDCHAENQHELLSQGMLSVTPRTMPLDLKSLNLNSDFGFYPQVTSQKDSSCKILLPHSFNEEIWFKILKPFIIMWLKYWGEMFSKSLSHYL